VNKFIDLVNIKIAASYFFDLFVEFFFYLRHECAHRNSSINLLVPRLKLFFLLLVQFWSNKLFKEALGGFHFVILFCVLDCDVQCGGRFIITVILHHYFSDFCGFNFLSCDFDVGDAIFL